MPEAQASSKEPGWTIRYRRSGKTLCTFEIKEKSFTVLVILGRKEVSKFEDTRGDFSTEIQEQFETTRQYHDGRWLFIKPAKMRIIDDIERLIIIKRKPKKRV